MRMPGKTMAIDDWKPEIANSVFRIVLASIRSIRRAMFLCVLFGSTVSAAGPSADMILVVGAPGSAEYGALFHEWSQRWIAAANRGSVPVTTIGRDESAGDRTDNRNDAESLHEALTAAASQPERPLWLVLIGHGTFDRKSARFNLRGPDLSLDELADWLEPLRRPIAVIDCSASSAPFLAALSSPNRIVITATKSGAEENFARFGDFLSRSIDDRDADLDKDDQTSLWEAYLAASRRTAEFYQSDGRLLTEHALLDDNGDRQGTRADLFLGLDLQKGVQAEAPLDGALAHQWHLVPSDRDARLPPDLRRRRDELELEIVALRRRKETLDTDRYYADLERLLVELAKLNLGRDE